jgi:O-antigen/teichoic acid export membrane protein
MVESQKSDFIVKGDLRVRAVRAIGAMALLQIIGAASTVLTLLVLSRLLSPRDFGIAAIVALVTSVIGTLGDFGLAPAVIQREQEIDEALYTANTMRFGISVTLFLVTLLIAPAASVFFSVAEATAPMRVAAFLFLINGAMFVPQTRLAKELKFGVLFRAAVASSVVSACVSIGLAFLGFGYWTIVLASIVAAIVNLAALWRLAPWRLRIALNLRIARELLGYGKYLFLTTIFVFFVLNIDNASVGYFLGTIALGYYALAFKWANVPANFLSRVAAQVMTPTYVLLRDAVGRLRKGYLETIQMIVVVSLPIYLGLLVLADDFVSFVLGADWVSIVLPLRIMCLLGIMRTIAEPGGYLFLATGKSELVSVCTGLHLMMTLALLPFGLLFGGFSGVAAAVTLAYALNLLVVQRYVRKELGVTWREISRLLRSVSLGGLAVICSTMILKISLGSSAIAFLVTAAGALVSYLLALQALEGDLIKRYLHQVLDAVRGV